MRKSLAEEWQSPRLGPCVSQPTVGLVICLSIRLSVCLPAWMLVRPFVRMSICLSVSLSIYLYVCPSVCLLPCLLSCLCVSVLRPSVRPSVRRSLCLSIDLSVRLSVIHLPSCLCASVLRAVLECDVDAAAMGRLCRLTAPTLVAEGGPPPTPSLLSLGSTSTHCLSSKFPYVTAFCTTPAFFCRI